MAISSGYVWGNSINNNEMFLLELETRLETDPLLPSGLLELMNDSEINPMCECYDNSRFVECICYSGSTYVQ